MFDIVYVTYNSSEWIDRCFCSLLEADYDLKRIYVTVVDNASTDNTVQLLEDFNARHGDRFGGFEIVGERKNWGFGTANNIGFRKGSSDYVCFLNIDTEVLPDTFSELEKEIADPVSLSGKDVALWEFRQLPYEHPKIYDILSGEAAWASGAAIAVRRDVFWEVGGFDEKIFMYAEDVDLSWRIRSAGYVLKYVPRVRIIHHAYRLAGEVKPAQYVHGTINNLLLRYRFGGRRDVLEGYRLFRDLARGPEAFPGARKMLAREYRKHFMLIPHFWAFGKYRKDGRFVGTYYGWEYWPTREGAWYENLVPEESPLVSILIRTCGRPAVLREALLSLRRQTYDNIEIVVVEDGEPVSEGMIKSEFADLDILYKATGEKVGRSRVGNLAMELAHGIYLNFLDDDDVLYAEHIEVLVSSLLRTGMAASYAIAYETSITVRSRDPYIYEMTDCKTVNRQPFSRLSLWHHNYIPIQCMMFKKELFEKYGGLDESLDALEDWDLWVRYSLHTDFGFVPKTTSQYRVPANPAEREKRQKIFDKALTVVREKHKGYKLDPSVYDLVKLYELLEKHGIT